MAKPLAWSFSAMGDFKNCPKQYYHKRIAKDVQDTQGEAALWGDRVHKFFEYMILEALHTPSQEPDAVSIVGQGGSTFKDYLPYLQAVLALPCDQLFPERQYAIGRDLRPCGWFDPEVWCRGIIDVLALKGDKAYAIDWKTGKRKPDSKQLKLFALFVFIHHPEIMSCKTEFVWLKTGERDTETYHRSQEAELWQEFVPDLAQYRAAFQTGIFPARKSGLCRGWCPVTSCEHWQPKKV